MFWMVLMIIAGALFAVSSGLDAADALNTCLYLAAWIAAIAGVVQFAGWLGERIASIQIQLARAAATTERVALLDKISRMTADQLEYAKAYVPVIEVISSSDGPVYLLRVSGGTVPLTFAAQFLGADTGEYLQPLRSFSDGSHERAWADSLTAWAIMQGWAAESQGNRPARWIDRDKALRSIGL